MNESKMLQTLSKLGKLPDNHSTDDTRIEHIIAIVFQSDSNKVEYVESKLLTFNSSETLLYQGPDPSGKPGLFLTGNMPSSTVKKLSNESTHAEFMNKKLMWFTKGKFVNNSQLMNTLDESRLKELRGILTELKDKKQQISKDVITILIFFSHYCPSDGYYYWSHLILDLDIFLVYIHQFHK